MALKSSHLETAYLLIYGSLPTKEQFKFFESEVMRHSVMHSDAEGFLRSFRCVHSPVCNGKSGSDANTSRAVTTLTL